MTCQLLQAAMTYAELGYAVFPCVPGRKEPLCEHGCNDATTDPDQIERWWNDRPSANIGIATTGLLVLDVDAGSQWLNDDQELASELMIAPLSLTAGNGRQFIFRQPGGKRWRNTAGRIAPHVDTRADGGYIVVPPSVLSGGRTYKWAEGMPLDVGPDRLPEPPAWLMELLDNLATPGQTSPRVAGAANKSNQIPSGQRNATLARLGGAMRRVGMSQTEIGAALHRANSERCSPPISDREVEQITASVSRYEPDQIAVAITENHWEQMFSRQRGADPTSRDPGPVPESMCRIPGFVSEVMDHCLATAPYPNVPLAFCGALALLATLTGRKIRDDGDNRTNIYVLALAYSAVGKDWPRKLNIEILHRAGLVDSLGEKFASGEGLQDALFISPTMLFQTDEIDGMLQSINKSADARHENIMGTMLTMYSAANSIYPMRRKAGKASPGVINQPSLIVYGTAIPTHYYRALSERMLTNGFFARMLIVESGRRSVGQDPGLISPPEGVLEVAKWWSEFRPGEGNLGQWHPVPMVVPATSEAKQLLRASREEAEAEYSRAEERSDPVGTTVWGRVHEQTRKLALLYAASVNHTSPEIGVEAVRWASAFVMHQTRRMLFMASGHVAENPFHAECLKLLKKLRDAPDQSLSHSVLLKQMRMDTKSFHELIQSLSQQGDIEVASVKTTGRSGIHYRLVSEREP